MAFFFHCIALLLLTLPYTHEQDLHSLVSFKSSADPLNASLQTWVGRNPCSGSWRGVKCSNGRVIGVYLDKALLVGNVGPLLSLKHLQVLSLRRNALSGSLPNLTNLTNPGLKHLFLSDNQLQGRLRIALPRLLSLRLEHNEFSGELSALRVPTVKDFNVSENHLQGEINGNLSKFSVMAFGGNPSLCGSPLPGCSVIKTTSISPSPTPSFLANTCSTATITKLGMTAILAIGIGDIVVISIALALIIAMYLWLKKKLSKTSQASSTGNSELELDGNLPEEEKKDIGLISFEGGEGLRLNCLLKASAEVLGKSVVGSTYKAVVDDGLVVAVKRLNAARFPTSDRAFDRRMQLIGRANHCHVVSLRAYYNANEEKLLVYDFMPNGSLHSLLQSSSLDWRRRKEVVMGAAHGLNYIHGFPSRSPLVHGNIKPSNILMDEQGRACISEWGLMCSITSHVHQSFPTHSSHLFSSTMNRRGYRAPELLNGKTKATQESDVYSFGMVLLEVVSGKEMEDGEECEGELMGMVKIGMMCTAEHGEERPKMSEVVSMIAEML